MFRVSNIGLKASLNFRIQNHKMKLVEVEGSHVIQNSYNSLDVHPGQSVTVLVTFDQPAKDYYIVASTRFTKQVLTATAVLHYTNSKTSVSGPLPAGPAPNDVQWSLNQAKTFRYTLEESSLSNFLNSYSFPGIIFLNSMLLWRSYSFTDIDIGFYNRDSVTLDNSSIPFCRWNLTANAARPNPQGSFHYGTIKPTKTFVLANSAPLINGKQRYAVNGVSYINPDTPLKLADHFNIPGVFSLNSISNFPSGVSPHYGVSVLSTSLHDFMEVVFQNNERSLQTWHLDGYDFWVVG